MCETPAGSACRTRRLPVGGRSGGGRHGADG
ncbi:hypothetical protein [Planomonospora corallina]